MRDWRAYVMSGLGALARWRVVNPARPRDSKAAQPPARARRGGAALGAPFRRRRRRRMRPPEPEGTTNHCELLCCGLRTVIRIPVRVSLHHRHRHHTRPLHHHPHHQISTRVHYNRPPRSTGAADSPVDTARRKAASDGFAPSQLFANSGLRVPSRRPVTATPRQRRSVAMALTLSSLNNVRHTDGKTKKPPCGVWCSQRLVDNTNTNSEVLCHVSHSSA